MNNEAALYDNNLEFYARETTPEGMSILTLMNGWALPVDMLTEEIEFLVNEIGLKREEIAAKANHETETIMLWERGIVRKFGPFTPKSVLKKQLQEVVQAKLTENI